MKTIKNKIKKIKRISTYNKTIKRNRINEQINLS